MVNIMAKVATILDVHPFFAESVTTIHASHPSPVRGHLWSVVLWLQSQAVGCRSPLVVALVLWMGWCSTSLSGIVWPLCFYKQIVHQAVFGFTATSLHSCQAAVASAPCNRACRPSLLLYAVVPFQHQRYGSVSKPCTPVVHIKIAGIYGCSSH